MQSKKPISIALCGLLLSSSVIPVMPKTVFATENAASASAEALVAINEVNFPDQAFRNWLLDQTHINGIGADGQLTLQERLSVTGLFLKRQGIKSLKGIEYFPQYQNA